MSRSARGTYCRIRDGWNAYNVVGMLDGAAETSVYSSLDGPIESLSMLRRSLLFAELANLSYLSRTEAGLLAHRIGFPEIRFYDRDGAQAYIFANERRCRRHLSRHRTQ